jgi:hypothetical protein
MLSFPPKDFSERITVQFDFSSEIVVEDISTGTEEVFIDVVSGFDNSPGKVLVGPAEAVGTIVYQAVEGGEPYTIYRLTCRVETTDGRLLSISAYLPISGYKNLYSETYLTNLPPEEPT